MNPTAIFPQAMCQGKYLQRISAIFTGIFKKWRIKNDKITDWQKKMIDIYLTWYLRLAEKDLILWLCKKSFLGASRQIIFGWRHLFIDFAKQNQ